MLCSSIVGNTSELLLKTKDEDRQTCQALLLAKATTLDGIFSFRGLFVKPGLHFRPNGLGFTRLQWRLLLLLWSSF